MTRANAALLAGLAVMFLFPAVRAEDSERTAVLALMDRVFDAVRTRNPDDWRALQLAEGANLSVRPATDDDPLRLGLVSNEEFVANMSGDGRIYLERWTSDPVVLIRGPIAIVWGEYEFWIDEEFSHCGVNTADLVKIDGAWKLANIMWTAERDTCPTAP